MQEFIQRSVILFRLKMIKRLNDADDKTYETLTVLSEVSVLISHDLWI